VRARRMTGSDEKEETGGCRRGDGGRCLGGKTRDVVSGALGGARARAFSWLVGVGWGWVGPAVTGVRSVAGR